MDGFTFASVLELCLLLFSSMAKSALEFGCVAWTLLFQFRNWEFGCVAWCSFCWVAFSDVLLMSVSLAGLRAVQGAKLVSFPLLSNICAMWRFLYWKSVVKIKSSGIG